MNLKRRRGRARSGGIMLVLSPFGLVFPLVFFCRPLRPFVKMALAGVALLVLFSCNVARASDVDCSVPPYGDTWGDYHAYVENFGAYVDPAKLLPAICEGKFKTGDRTTYYKLGISPQDFATKGVTDLAIEMLGTMRKLARQVSPSNPEPDIAPGVLYAPYTCSRSANVCDPPTDPAYVFSTMSDCDGYLAMLGNPHGEIYAECLSVSAALPWPLPEISAEQAPAPPVPRAAAPTAAEIQQAEQTREAGRGGHGVNPRQDVT